MHYFLFLERDAAKKQDELGLNSILTGTGAAYREITRGPGNAPGMLVTWSPEGHRAPSDLDDRQNWEQHPDGWWLGWYKEDPPNPEDLKKPEQYESIGAELGDGMQWDIPVARMLPCQNGMDLSTGKYVRRVKPEFQEYWEQCGKFVDEFFAQLEEFENTGTETVITVSTPMAMVWDFSCRALAMNYRLTPAIIHMLGLLPEDIHVVRVAIAATEMPLRVQQVREKKSRDLPDIVGVHTMHAV